MKTEHKYMNIAVIKSRKALLRKRFLNFQIAQFQKVKGKFFEFLVTVDKVNVSWLSYRTLDRSFEFCYNMPCILSDEIIHNETYKHN